MEGYDLSDEGYVKLSVCGYSQDLKGENFIMKGVRLNHIHFRVKRLAMVSKDISHLTYLTASQPIFLCR